MKLISYNILIKVNGVIFYEFDETHKFPLIWKEFNNLKKTESNSEIKLFFVINDQEKEIFKFDDFMTFININITKK